MQPIETLDLPSQDGDTVSMEDLTALINKALDILNLKFECVSVSSNRNFVNYELKLTDGSNIKNLYSKSEELSFLLKSKNDIVIEKDFNKGTIIVKSTNGDAPIVNLKDLSGSADVLLGKTELGETLSMNLIDNPHLLIAGTTGSGKSVLLHTIIHNLSNNKNSIFISDPKMGNEFARYNKKVSDIAFNYESTLDLVQYLTDKMNLIYRNKQKPSSNTVLIIDEIADLMLQDKKNRGRLSDGLVKLAQKSRAAQIYLILATQRPSHEVLTTTIKANFPARISCKVASSLDSRIILDSVGAEKLNGNGDALLINSKNDMTRFQVAYPF